MNKKEKLIESIVKSLTEDTEIINENIIEVPIETIVEQVISYLKNETNVDLSFKDIIDNKVRFNIVNGEDNNITVLKDRLNINSAEQGLESNNQVTEIKRMIIKTLEDNFSEFKAEDLKLRSITDLHDIIFIDFYLYLKSIPNVISLTFKLFDDGHVEIRVNYHGDSREERWSKNAYDTQSLIDIIKDIESYYDNKIED